MPKPLHRRGSYQRQARTVRARAYANPDTRCWRCGKTLAEHPPGTTWDAGHVHDGQAGGELRPEGSWCNRSAGGRLGNRRRIGINLTHDW